MKAYKFKPKICVRCGEIFSPTSGRQTKCSDCANKPEVKVGKCKACGKKFKYTHDRQIFCSVKCSKDFCNYSENTTIDNVYITENERLCKPSKEYIKEIDYMLKDFNIDISIPEFESVAQLDKWKSDIIRKNL